MRARPVPASSAVRPSARTAASSATARFVDGPDRHVETGRTHGADSDHRPVVFTVGGVAVLSWNVAFQYAARKGGGVNNGFGRTSESADAYAARLRRTGARVERMVRAEAPPVVVLQEAGRAGAPATLARDLARRLGPLGYAVTSAGELVTATKGASTRLALPADLARQGGTMDALRLEARGAAPPVVVVNAHWRFDATDDDARATASDVRAVVAALRRQAPGAPIVFVGDVNRDAAALAHVAGALADVVPPPGPTNLRWNADRARAEPTYADAAFVFA